MKEIVYNNFQRWVPESDIDGIDIKPEILSELRNVIAQNGFIKNAVDLVPKTLPENVQSLIDNNYELIGYTNFNHSSQGFQEIFIVWSASNTHVALFLGNQFLDVYGTSDFTICDTKPYNINYNLINDQLKINLNCKGYILEKWVRMNLTLQYIDETIYVTPLEVGDANIVFSGTGVNDVTATIINQIGYYNYTLQIEVIGTTPDRIRYRVNTPSGNGAWSEVEVTAGLNLIIKFYFSVTFANATGHQIGDTWTITKVTTASTGIAREAGWLLTPRWIGWQIDENSSDVLFNGETSERIEDFEDTTLQSWIEPYSNSMDRTLYNGSWRLIGYNSLSYGQPRAFKIHNVLRLKSLKFTLMAGYFADGEALYMSVFIYDADNKLRKTVYKNESEDGGFVPLDKTIDFSNVEMIAGDTIIVYFIVGARASAAPAFVAVDDITLEYQGNFLLVEKTYDGQRGKIQYYEDVAFPIFANQQFGIKPDKIDWRVAKYEIYEETDSVFYLKYYAEVGGWNVDGSYIKRTLTKMALDNVQTLNFNYGLGDSVRVDTQHEIFSEVTFNNRVYAVNGGYQILQTHIAGSGRVQPDAFPYDEDSNYGFIEESKSSSIQTLFVINNNFLLLFMLDGFSLYTIAINRGTFQKDLRLLASSFTGFNPLSLTRTITGISPTIGSYWVTREGIWFHDGSMGGVPINLITETHKNFWREEVDTTLFGFYDYEDNEYWYAYHKETDREETSFLVYEINYKTFRYVRIAKAYTGFAGYYLGKVLLFAGDAIETLDKSGTLGLQGYTEMHFNDLGNKYSNKIGQELFITLKEAYSGSSVLIRANFDNRWSVYYTISTDEKQMVRLLPISARFRTVQLSVLFGKINSTPMLISDFGMRYTEDGQGRLGECLEHRVEVEGFGYGKAYGRYYGGSSPVGETGYGTSYGKNYGN